MKTNIALIGMAGAGKSSVGSELASLLGLAFVDVDILIEEDQGLPLQEVLKASGLQGFRVLEEKILLSLNRQNHVIATGGSAIYSDAGMKHLKKTAYLVLLDVALPVLEQRVGDFAERGLVKEGSQSFAQLFAERQPLYRNHADLIVPCTDRSVADVCRFIQDWWQQGHCTP
ncbi:MAG: shikimate kinase [Proteobacteria bacterium]|nr:shikimate kinase [Pseudomonadota bacterium]MBU1232412.1 shikimate kinase [Pseudomonadota bacterium]MBU1417199.1 shikimate kinase [Pseudomonadota bacterium]MBU1453627.1 shikimate kinase [Pseudomonadota bacterium]